MRPRIKVLIVDDSAFARKVVREALAPDPTIEVVGVARDGFEALDKIAELKPDVVMLDLNMPELDGVGVLRASVGPSRPRFVIVTAQGARSELVLEALALGAVDVVEKPTARADPALYGMSGALHEAVVAASMARVLPLAHVEPVAPVAAEPIVAKSTEIVVIGASTGGPQALRALVPALPRGFPVPIVVGVHLPRGYTESMAERLDAESELDVVEARNGMEIRGGTVALAPGGFQTRISRRSGGGIALEVGGAPDRRLYAPSVDQLLGSAADARLRVLGVVLTGMGDDGLEGARKVVASGGSVLSEAEATCSIYGMPRAVYEARLSEAVPLTEMVAAIVRKL